MKQPITRSSDARAWAFLKSSRSYSLVMFSSRGSLVLLCVCRCSCGSDRWKYRDETTYQLCTAVRLVIVKCGVTANEELHVGVPVMYHVLFFLFLLQARVSPFPNLSHLLFVSALFRCWCLKRKIEIQQSLSCRYESWPVKSKIIIR